MLLCFFLPPWHVLCCMYDLLLFCCLNSEATTMSSSVEFSTCSHVTVFRWILLTAVVFTLMLVVRQVADSEESMSPEARSEHKTIIYESLAVLNLYLCAYVCMCVRESRLNLLVYNVGCCSKFPLLH